MRIQGDGKAIRHLIYNQRLVKPPDEKAPGPITMAIEDFGGYLVLDSTDPVDSTTLPPVGASDTGQFVEIYSRAFGTFDLDPSGGDSISGNPTRQLGFCTRGKAKCIGNNEWSFADRRHQTAMIQPNHCCLNLIYDASNFQSLATNIGDPPTFASATKLDLSQATAITDTNSLFNAGNDSIDIPSEGYYLVEANLQFKGNGTGSSKGFVFLANNGSSIASQGKTLGVTYVQTMRLTHIARFDAGDELDLRAGAGNAESMELSGLQLVIKQLPSGSMREEPLVVGVDMMLALMTDTTPPNSSPFIYDTVDVNTGSSISLDTATGIFTLNPGTYYLEAGLGYNFTASTGHDTWQWHDSVPNPIGTKVKLRNHNSSLFNGSFTHAFAIHSIAGPGTSTVALRRATEGGTAREKYVNDSYAIIRKLR